MEIKSLKVNIILNYIRITTTILFPLLTFSYASRILLTEGMGKVRFVSSVIVYLQLIASLGLSTYAIREGTKLREDKHKISVFSREMLIINMTSMIISYIILVGLLFIPKFKPYKSELVLYSAVLLFSVISMEWLYSIYEDFLYITIRAIVFQVISFVLLFILVKSKEDTNKYILLTVISTTGSSIFNLIHSRHYIDWKVGFKGLKIRHHMKPILIIFGMTLATKIYLNMDVIMISMIKGDHYSGLYSAATQINTALSTFITAISGVTLPRLAIYIGNKDMKEFRKLVKSTMQYLMFATIPTITGLFFVSKNVIMIVSGAKFVDASITMKIILPNLFCSIMNGFIAYQIFMPFKKEKWSFVATLLGAATNFILNSLFIPFWAQNGAAVATVITEMVIFIVCIVYSKKLMDMKDIFTDVYKDVIAALSYPVVWLIMRALNLTNNIACIFVEVIFGTMGYFIVLWLMKSEFFLGLLDEARKILRRKING